MELNDKTSSEGFIGDYETAFASAEHASPSGGMSWGMAYWHPSLKGWRADERFNRIVERLQLPDYWRAAGWPDACTPVSFDEFKCAG